MNEKNFALRIDKNIFKDIKEEAKDAGISINSMINIKLKGYKLINV